MIVGWYTYTHVIIITSSSFISRPSPAVLFLFFSQFRQMKKKTNTISACEWHAPEDGSRKWLEFRPLTPPLQVQDNCAQELLLLPPQTFRHIFFFWHRNNNKQNGKNASGWIFHSLFSKNTKNSSTQYGVVLTWGVVVVGRNKEQGHHQRS